jgi:hypothetical protein
MNEYVVLGCGSLASKRKRKHKRASAPATGARTRDNPGTPGAGCAFPAVALACSGLVLFILCSARYPLCLVPWGLGAGVFVCVLTYVPKPVF